MVFVHYGTYFKISNLCLFFRHIKEELDNIYTEEEIKNMNHDELAFTFFS